MIIVALLFILLIINILLVVRDNYIKKINRYTRVFLLFDNVLNNFDIKYYFILLFFLLFDIGAVFFIPRIFSMDLITKVSLFSIIFFYFVLFLEFYRWYVDKLKILSSSVIYSLKMCIVCTIYLIFFILKRPVIHFILALLFSFLFLDLV